VSQPTPAAPTTTAPPTQQRPPEPRSEVIDTPAPQALRFPDDLPTVTLDVNLMYRERWMQITQRVELTNTSTDEWEEVVFNAPIRAVPDAFYLDGAQAAVNGQLQEGIPPNTPPRNVIRMPLDPAATPGDAITITFEYRVLVPPVEPTSWPPVGTTGWTLELLQAGEFYPALVPYIDGEWQAVRYHPVGDPTFYALTTTRLNVTPDDPAVTIVSGGPVGRDGDTWQFEVHGARGIAFFASPLYQSAEGEVDGIPVYSYFLAEHALGGQSAVTVAEDSIRLFEDLIGPYPYESLVVVENGFFGGMEYSALASITDYAYLTYQSNPNSVLHALIAHEVAHQWWYGAVGNNQAEEAWLDESLGFYGEYLYYEKLHPAYTEWWWDARVLQFERYGPVDATIYSYSESSEFILSMYGQAAFFIAELRRAMGDEAFFAFLQDYYTTHYGGIVTGADFFEAARRHTDDAIIDELQEAYFANTDM
jgi:hypothetical protein